MQAQAEAYAIEKRGQEAPAGLRRAKRASAVEEQALKRTNAVGGTTEMRASRDARQEFQYRRERRAARRGSLRAHGLGAMALLVAHPAADAPNWFNRLGFGRRAGELPRDRGRDRLQPAHARGLVPPTAARRLH